MIAAWPLFYSSGYSRQWVTETGETMLCVEKDDPREAPESGDKASTCEKITRHTRLPTGTAGGFLFPGTIVNCHPDGLTARRDARRYHQNQKLTPSTAMLKG
jgi:hypothetical protein